MATSISISKNGGKCEVALDGGPQYFEVSPIKVDLGFNTNTNYINVYFPIQDGIFAQAFPMASVTLGGVVITSKSVFDTQVAAVFPNTNSGGSVVDKEYVFDNEFHMPDINSGVTTAFNASAPAVVKDTWLTTFYQNFLTGFVSRIYSVTFTACETCRFVGQIKQNSALPDGRPFVTYPININIPAGGGNVKLDFGPKGVEVGELGQLRVDVNPHSTVYPQPEIFITAKSIPNDTNYNAIYVIGSIGDSISLPGTLGTNGGIANYGSTHYMGRIGTSLVSNGFSIRKRYLGFNAAKSLDLVTAIKAGLCDAGIIPDLLLINIGINDAGAGTAAAMSYQDNVEYVIDWYFSKKPNGSIILVAPTSTDLSPTATNVPAYRATLQNIIDGSVNSNKYATQVAGNKLKYADASAGLTVNDANFVESGTGQHLHPNGHNGHVIVYNNIWPVLQTTKFYLDNN